MSSEWLQAIDWSARQQPFVAIERYDDGRDIVAMVFQEAQSARWSALRTAWLGLSHCSPILDALDSRHSSLLVRYAAISWGTPRLHLSDVDDVRRLAAKWLLDLIDAYRAISMDGLDSLNLFWNPVLLLSLDGHLRLAFRSEPSDDEMPPELQKKHARWDERTVVYKVGQLFAQHVTVPRGSMMQRWIETSMAANPSRRYDSLDAQLVGLEILGFEIDEVRNEPNREDWLMLEEGLGWLQLRDYANATRCLQSVITPEYAGMAKLALSVLRRGKSPDRTPATTLELARNALNVGDVGYAAMLANEHLARVPGSVEALAILVGVHLRNRHYDRALTQIDKMPEDGRTQYLRGKALLGMGRLYDARDAFDRACVLDPKLLEAMLLRREADRLIRTQRREVGEHKDAVIEIPPSLAELRDILVSGDLEQAIIALSAYPYSEQPEAQLVLARLVAFAGYPERACLIYERAAGSESHRYAALLGKAGLLVDLSGRAESALAIFDDLCAQQPTDPDTSEGRARALEKLGRLGEAAAEFRRFISLATSRSDIRVRAAADWLRDHPL